MRDDVIAGCWLLLLQSHSSVEKAGLIGLVKMRLLSCDDKLSLRGDSLRQAIEEDKRSGLIPFFVRAPAASTC